ncbi:MAG: hypothetical protein C3F02_02745 [Parcubacteria group bacterium]|nr:MAG: hypothetical protein C3F02_02745 [Parcubacteria group bacterium]
MENPEIMPANQLTKAERERQNIEQQSRSRIYEIFDKFNTANERVDDIFNNLKNILTKMPNSEEIKSELEALRQIEEKGHFCEKAFTILEQIIEWRENNLQEFEEIRRNDFNEQGDFIELNKMLSYNIDGDSIHIHVPPNVSTSNSEKINLVYDGLKKLAQIVDQNPAIKTIVGTSWIVAEHPALMTKLHFTLEGKIDETSRAEHFPAENREIAVATMSRDELIKHYL